MSLTKGAVDPVLYQLFSTSLNKGPLKAAPVTRPKKPKQADDEDLSEIEDGSEADDSSASEPGSDSDLEDDGDEEPISEDDDADEPKRKKTEPAAELAAELQKEPKQLRTKRKRDDDADLEEKYLAKLDRIADADEKRSKRQKADSGKPADETDDDDAESGDESAESDFEVPKHETQDGSANKSEVDQANRTVFLGNVSTDAIKSKESLKELKTHMISFLDENTQNKSQSQIESIRFRSVAFASTALPRKAAFAKKELMDATTKSTNAYVVYNTSALAKSAVQKLNGTVVLDRHLRVDSVAHPAAVDHRRCVFVGNLGFVDDVSLMQETGEDEKPRKKKTPSDVEEGLWRQFGKAGTVESVRVIRDKSTRVGKGFAYVQFTDQVAVEKALEFNEKRFPPLLPRTLRVTRAKKITKTNAYKEKQGKGRALAEGAANGEVYNPKVDPDVQTAKGRATKMFGRAGAAQIKKGQKDGAPDSGIRRPESFVFEGHRARDAEGKGTMKLKQKKKGGKPQTRSSKRGAAFKAAGRKT